MLASLTSLGNGASFATRKGSQDSEKLDVNTDSVVDVTTRKKKTLVIFTKIKPYLDRAS